MLLHTRAGRGLFTTLPVMFLFSTGCAVKPKELGTEQLSDVARSNIAVVAADQELVHGSIDLYEAIARALKYNLDHRVEIAELALRERELRLAHLQPIAKCCGQLRVRGARQLPRK